MKKEIYLRLSIYQTLLALSVLFTICAIFPPKTASAQNSPASKNESVNQEKSFDENFREGRNLIDRQEWARAAEKFRAAVEKSPDHKLADAALYWLAFCHRKQNQFNEAVAALDRLVEKFPGSSWVGDAQVMKMEIAPLLTAFFVSGNVNSNLKQVQLALDAQADLLKGNANSLQDIYGQTAGTNDLLTYKSAPLDRQDEIKIAAFQSLLAADPKRAIETMGDVLKPDSKASESLKQEILRVWRRPRFFTSQTLTDSIGKNTGGGEFAALLRETLVKSFQNETNLKIRNEIIYALASIGDGQSIELLKKLYASENDREIKKTIINSFGSSASLFYVVDFSATQKQKAEVDLSREQTHRVGFDVLLEILRAEKDSELRQLAFSNLRRFPNWRTSERAVEVLTNLYDAETGEEFKISIIRDLAEFKQNQATRKLLGIAKDTESDKLRLEAIRSLRNSKNPEVLKFLEELIK